MKFSVPNIKPWTFGPGYTQAEQASYRYQLSNILFFANRANIYDVTHYFRNTTAS